MKAGPIADPYAHQGRLARARRKLGGKLLIASFEGLSALGRLSPVSNPVRHGVSVERDVAYLDDGDPMHRLDVYRRIRPARPYDVDADGRPPPALLYLHGGAFQYMSRKTHWLMGIQFARRGFVVFNADYRLAPRHRFPAAPQDACSALLWMRQNASRFGADPERIVVAGESAGGNLALVTLVAHCYERPEPWARAVFDADLGLRAVLPACGILQATDPGRFGRRRRLSPFLRDRLHECSDGYLPQHPHSVDLALADPLVMLEREAPARPLPPILAVVGTGDPLLDDTRRLERAVRIRGGRCEALYYPRSLHAFHALPWDPHMLPSWRAQLDFAVEACR
jgi:acetyl esterase